MIKAGLKMALVGLLLVAVAVMAGCGGGGSGSSSSGSLSLVLDKTSVASGGVVVATVTLSSSTGQPVNDVPIRVMSSNNTVVASASGKTNMSGVAYVTLSAQWVNADKTISLSAGSDVTGNSESKTLVVVAPKLTASFKATSDHSIADGPAGGIVGIDIQGGTVKFLDGNGNPIVNQVIDVTITSKSSTDANEVIVFYPSPGVTIPSPSGVLTVTTDNTGTAYVDPWVAYVRIPAKSQKNVVTFSWKASTEYAGQPYVLTGSMQFTISNS